VTVRASASGRVNLIGEHTDYNGGFVLPMLIPVRTTVMIRPSRDRIITLRSDATGMDPIAGSLDDPRARGLWSDYVVGVAETLMRRGMNLGGFDAHVASDVPVGAGLASSAALLVATVRALREAFALEIDDREVARVAHEAEYSYVGARVVYTLGRAVTEARELGSYRLVERLGQGGMGEVWRAKHRLLARPAAIKLIRAADGAGTAAQQEAIRRFEREAQVTAGLSSPHTVQLFDFGVADDGSFYYVMELLNGLDLERLVQRYGPIPAERAVYLLRQVCQSLAEAESYGLVHRDIKPANLFVCRYGGEHDFLKVLDFGIAKPAPDMMQTGAMGFTQDNVLQGTPAYIAPEQVMNGSNVDGRADIYATGCVGYFLLTGKPVFTGDTPMAVVVQHAHSQPAAPSESSELPIPPALDRLILDCLAKSPSDRPQSARELSQRLAEVDMANAWTEDRARDWWGTHQPVPKSRLSVAGPEAESARHA